MTTSTRPRRACDAEVRAFTKDIADRIEEALVKAGFQVYRSLIGRGETGKGRNDGRNYALLVYDEQ